MKVILNRSEGSFGLSVLAKDLYVIRAGLHQHPLFVLYRELIGYYNKLDRHDPHLVAVVEELGENANSLYSKLKVVEVDCPSDYEIEEFDGYEFIK